MIRLRDAVIINTVAIVAVLLLWFERIQDSGHQILDNLPFLATDSVLTAGALVISAVTSPAVVITLAVCGALLATLEHHIKLWWLLAGTLATGTAVSMLLKQLFVLPRPDYSLLLLGSYGFPSTHATVATALLVSLIWLIFHKLPKQKTARLVSLILVFTGWGIIGASRLLLGVHTLDDVMAGIIVGTGVGVMVIALKPTLLKYWRINYNNKESNG